MAPTHAVNDECVNIFRSTFEEFSIILAVVVSLFFSIRALALALSLIIGIDIIDVFTNLVLVFIHSSEKPYDALEQ